MAKYKDAELKSSHGYTKVATICRVAIDENGQKTGRGDLLKLEMLGGNHREMGGMVKMWYCQDPQPQVGKPQKGG